MTVDAYGEHLGEELHQLRQALQTGTYQSQPVKRVELPKSDGSTRPLGIPTVRDRVV